jgi:hypothetical protein
MAKSFVSAGVFTNEIDASFLGAGVGAIGAALVGTAPQGPAFVPVSVTDYSEYTSYFGPLNTSHILGYAARSYLRNAGSAKIVRVLGPEGRTVNGAEVTAGYTAESIWGITAGSGSVGAIMALLEITGSHDLVINDLGNDLFDVRITGSIGSLAAVTASFLTSSSNYIKKVLNADPTLFSSVGYYVRDTYDYAFKTVRQGNALYSSASYAVTNFQFGYNSGSTPWIKSQLFGGSSEYNLFRVHTLGHGEAENGRLKISVTNIRPSAAPTISEFGKFDLEVRSFSDTDKSKSVVESFVNLSLNPSDNNYICRVVGDKHFKYDVSREKLVEYGDYTNGSRLIRVEMTTGSYPDAAAPWGFRGLSKPNLSVLSGSGAADTGVDVDVSSAILAVPYVADLNDKETQSEAQTSIYWGMETVASGSVLSRLTKLPTMTGSDADFSLTNVSGSSLSTLLYNASNPVASQKSPGTSTSHTTLDSSLAKFTVPVAFGFDGFDRRLADPLNNESQLAAITQLGIQALRQGIDVVSDPDAVDINLLAIPGVYSSKVVDYAIIKVENRADVFYVADVSGSTPTAIIQEVKNRGFDTNYAAVYYPSIKVYDDINKVAKELPASVAAVGAIAFNDRVSYPWFAPAGLNRAGLGRDTIGFDVLGVMDQLKQSERDSLYEARINPIARFPDVPQGVIWGQKTLQLKSSALDRINVRRLMIKAKKLVASAAKYLVFEPGNATTQTRFRQSVNPIFAEIQQKQGLEKFLVVMDSTTNPPEVIDRNELRGKIYLVPTRTAEAISVDFVISPSGASFEE